MLKDTLQYLLGGIPLQAVDELYAMYLPLFMQQIYKIF